MNYYVNYILLARYHENGWSIKYVEEDDVKHGEELLDYEEDLKNQEDMEELDNSTK